MDTDTQSHACIKMYTGEGGGERDQREGTEREGEGGGDGQRERGRGKDNSFLIQLSSPRVPLNSQTNDFNWRKQKLGTILKVWRPPMLGTQEVWQCSPFVITTLQFTWDLFLFLFFSEWCLSRQKCNNVTPWNLNHVWRMSVSSVNYFAFITPQKTD